MTAKNYQLTASILFAERAKSLASLSKTKYRDLCREFAVKLKAHNSRFDWNKFAKACGLED